MRKGVAPRELVSACTARRASPPRFAHAAPACGASASCYLIENPLADRAGQLHTQINLSLGPLTRVSATDLFLVTHSRGSAKMNSRAISVSISALAAALTAVAACSSGLTPGPALPPSSPDTTRVYCGDAASTACTTSPATPP